MLAWKLFWDYFGRFSYQDLLRSSPAAAGPFYDDLARFSYRSWHEDLGHKVLYNSLWSLWEDLVDIPVKFSKSSVQVQVKCNRRPLYDLAQVLVRRNWRVKSSRCPRMISYEYRSLWEDLGEFQLNRKRFLHFYPEDALLWCLYETSSEMLICMKMLWKSLYIEGHSVTILVFWRCYRCLGMKFG